MFTLLTCQLNATPEVAALRPPYESMTTSAAATLFISSSFSLSLLLSFCSRSKCQICNVPGQLPQKGKIRVGPLRSSPSVGSVTLGLVNRGANLCFLPTVGGESAIFHQTQRQKSHPWYLRSNMVIGKSVTISNLSQQYPIVLKSEMSCLYTFSGSFLTRFSSEIESDPVGEYPRAATCLESLGIDPSTVTDEDFSSLR